MSVRDSHMACEQLLAGNINTTKAGLTINAASAATVKTATALSYTIGGIFYSKAALAAQALLSPPEKPAYAVQPVNSTVYYVVSLDAAGTVYTTQGDWLGRLIPQTVAVGDGNVPEVPANRTPIGYVKVVTNGATTFTPGTTALDAVGLTVTFADTMVNPGGQP